MTIALDTVPPRQAWGDRARLALSRWGNAPLALFWLVIVAILVLPIVLFLAVAFSPRLFDAGPQWFTLQGFRQALSGTLLTGVLDSLMVGVASALAATAIGFAVAWLVLRTDVPGRRLWSGAMYALLLAPSYLVALGWQRLLEPMGVLDVLGLHPGAFRSLFYGPFGVIVVLAVKGVPFAFLAISGALRGLGEEFEVAARVHGGSSRDAMRIVISLLAPAVWSALAIVFAESISDFGVADTLASAAHFPVATFLLYNSIEAFPVNFPVAAAVGWILMGMAGLALLAQSRALKGRSYRVLGGRSRPARRSRLSSGKKVAAVACMALLVITALGVPTFGAVSASLINGLGSLVGSHGFTLANYRRVLDTGALRGPLMFSARMALTAGTLTVVMAAVSARLLGARQGRVSSRMLDLMLLTAVALPGIVFAAGYIFTYNLPVTNHLGVHLYETSTLLVLGYLATALPSTTRVLLGPVSQVQNSLAEAGRVHGSGAAATWFRTVLPVLARPLVAAWVLTFAGTLLELPVSQLLYPPNHPPVSVGIEHALANYDFGGGTAMEVIAVLFALVVVAAAWGLFRLLAPAGWRRIGTGTAR
ncbi:MAG TPA: ABC transporter permease subunit [Acidimicrobiales bacterium]|nr:ABC transporter permease subunit [Acidimicrobiales bacterium]